MAVLPDSLTKEQKIGFSLLVVFAFLSVGLGLVQIRNTMYGPLALNNEPPVDLKNQVATIDALRYRDTDHDEINDFDELYVYGTSPYLFDTFSYGMSDREVLAKGLPLCPKGQDCVAPAASEQSLAVSDASSTAAALAAQLGEPPPDLVAILQDPKQLRGLLLSGGMDKATLDKINDDQLKLMGGQILAATSTRSQLEQIQRAANVGVGRSSSVSTTLINISPTP
ncbi:MAG: hypothetical protein Q7K39_04395 [Candidatus Magasanikbacteria bacterium]|nr:hypothetical protein [Candidatus Magasanikbacteria bacterium]